MDHAAMVLTLIPVSLLLLCAVLYPAALALLARLPSSSHLRRHAVSPPQSVTVVLTCHNEACELPGALEALFAQDWPVTSVQTIVASDASTDATDSIALSFRTKGVALQRRESRGGKTMAENSLVDIVTGDVIFFMDAASRPDPDCCATMLRAFSDPGVGVVSSRDAPSMRSPHGSPFVTLESRYLAHEMWLRELETGTGGIIGASGSLFAIRRPLFVPLASHTTRDFASVLLAHHLGLRSVSVPATCRVRPAKDLPGEGERLSRTMAHGMATLIHYRHWLHPIERPGFVLKLFCHKVARWSLLPASIVAIIGLTLHAGASDQGRVSLMVGAALLMGWLGLETWMVRQGRQVQPWFRAVGVGLFACAALGRRVLSRQRATHWEPTKR